MDKNIRFKMAKYLFPVLALVPGGAKAKMQQSRSLPNNLYATCGTKPLYFTINGGLVYDLPVVDIDNKLGKRQNVSFNGGGYIEVGGACWRRIYGSDMEVQLEPVLRFEVLSLNTCAYAINEDLNGKRLPKPVELYPYESVQNFLTTANFNCGIGYKGIAIESSWGIGWHSDTKHQNAMAISIGVGVSGRISNRCKIRALYRANMNIKDEKLTAPYMRNGVEVGITYMFFPKQSVYCISYGQHYGRRR